LREILRSFLSASSLAIFGSTTSVAGASFVSPEAAAAQHAVHFLFAPFFHCDQDMKGRREETWVRRAAQEKIQWKKRKRGKKKQRRWKTPNKEWSEKTEEKRKRL
jgi:hypothetical protein